jgi:hypothetical protein
LPRGSNHRPAAARQFQGPLAEDLTDSCYLVPQRWPVQQGAHLLVSVLPPGRVVPAEQVPQASGEHFTPAFQHHGLDVDCRGIVRAHSILAAYMASGT